MIPTASQFGKVASRAMGPKAVTPNAPTNARVRQASAQIARPSAGLGFNAK